MGAHPRRLLGQRRHLSTAVFGGGVARCLRFVGFATVGAEGCVGVVDGDVGGVGLAVGVAYRCYVVGRVVVVVWVDGDIRGRYVGVSGFRRTLGAVLGHLSRRGGVVRAC